MNIGIMTNTQAVNYGAVLQNYALTQVLSGLGHNPMTINVERRRGGDITIILTKYPS